MKCILQCEPSGWVKHPKFKWWPADVPWSPIILTKKHQTPVSYPFLCYFYCIFYLVISWKFIFFRYGGQSFRELWGVVMITMDAGTSSSFQQSCTKWLELSSLKITGMEQLPCLIVIPGSSWSHSGMKTWYTIFNVLLIWKKLNFFSYISL